MRTQFSPGVRKTVGGKQKLTYGTINPKSGHPESIHGFLLGENLFIEQHLFSMGGTTGYLA